MWPTLRVENPGDSVIGGAPSFPKFYIQELDLVLTMNNGEKYRPAFGRRREKEPF